jgi:ElaA protein
VSATPSALPPPAPAASVAWQWRAFDDLTLRELYAVLQLRQAVFIVEQRCPYPDADGYDDRAWHLLGWVDAGDAAAGAPVLGAYARVFAPGVKYAEASIGRVITNPVVRRGGFGKALMTEAVRRCAQVAPSARIRIGAQLYLERFYESFGFRRASEPYDEDAIMHIEMVRAAPEEREHSADSV